MTRIESIRPAGALTVITFDDGAPLRCTRDFARRLNVRRGQAIDPVFIARLRESAAADHAERQAERLNRRGRDSRRAIAAKLQQAGIPDAAAARALDQLAARGELDDGAAALAYARRSLRQALQRDPELNWSSVRQRYGRRLALRGFAPGESSAALRQAWSELSPPPLAPCPEQS